VFETPEAMIASGIVDCVVAAATPTVHAEVAKACLDQGVDCLVEKPPCMGLDQLEVLLGLEARARSRIAVGMNFRHAAPLTALRRAMFGDVGKGVAYGHVRIQANMSGSKRKHYVDSRAELLYELGIHGLDLAVSLFDARRLQESFDFESGKARRFFCRFENSDGGISDVEIVGAPGRFGLEIEAEGRTGARFTLRDLQVLSIENASEMVVSDRILGMSGKHVYEWPIRRNSFEKCGYRQVLEAFVGGATQDRSDLESLRLTYQVIQELL
jgi:predicted dehydrogenase